jgi:hypothetical protein
MTNSKNTKDLTKDLFPQELHKCTTWLNWMVFDTKHGKKVKPYKSAIPKNGKYTVDPHNPSIWASLDEAIIRANADEGVQVGISLTLEGLKINDSFLWCLDFDGFSAPEGDDDGVLELVRELRTYAEFSPSGTGIKMFFLSDKEPVLEFKIHFAPSKFAVKYTEVSKYKKREIEVFSQKRFLAMTGEWYSEKAELPLKNIPEAELDELLDKLNHWAINTGGTGKGKASIPTGGNKTANAAPTAKGNGDYGKLTEACLKDVLAKINHHDESVWTAVRYSLARVYGESGRSYFIQWSKDGYGQKVYEGFDESEANSKFDKALGYVSGKSGYTCKNLYELAGVDPQLLEWEEQEFTPEQKAHLDAILGGIGQSADTNQPSLAIDKPSDIIELFNKDHFAAIEGVTLWVFKEAFDAELKVNKLDRFRPQSFKDLHNQSTLIDGKSKRIGDYWFNHQDRKTYMNGFVFMPEGDCPSGTYNLWRGFGVEPVQGVVTPILDYIKKVLCTGDQTNYDYLINWLAYGVQHADRQGEVAAVLRGLKGTGKSTLGRLMVKIYGRHGMPITNSRHLVGNFNAHLREKVFLFADEAFFAGDRQAEDVLKGLVTEGHATIEKKGVDPVTARNRLQILMSSNHDWVVPASSDERRYFILDVSGERIGDRPYWDQLNKCINNGGAEAFLYYLQGWDLTGFDVRTVPNTTGLDAQKLQNLGSIESVVNRWLSFGKVCGYKWASHEGLKVSTDGVFNEVKDFCKESPRHRYDTPSPETIGKKLKLLVGATKKRRREGKDLAYVYALPSLEDARATFTANMKLTRNFWSDEDLVDDYGDSLTPQGLQLVV